MPGLCNPKLATVVHVKGVYGIEFKYFTVSGIVNLQFPCEIQDFLDFLKKNGT